jgi:hypothetical protein
MLPEQVLLMPDQSLASCRPRKFAETLQIMYLTKACGGVIACQLKAQPCTLR